MNADELIDADELHRAADGSARFEVNAFAPPEPDRQAAARACLERYKQAAQPAAQAAGDAQAHEHVEV